MSSKHKKLTQILFQLLSKFKFAIWIGINLRTNLIMTSILLLSSIFCFLGNSWVIIWTILELNTLSFCCIMKNNTKRDIQKRNEIVIKYLLIQVIASGMLLISTSWIMILKSNALTIYFLRSVAIIIKAASSPFHQWFINVSKSIKWSTNIVLFTWQKLAPLYLIIFQIKNIILIFILRSCLRGAISLINKKGLKEIIAYSSVFNLGWIITGLIISTKLFLLFSVIYWFSVYRVVIIIRKGNLKTLEEIKKKINNWSSIILVANLAGIPPLIRFIAKWIVFSVRLRIKLFTLISFILVIRTINFYIYLRFSRRNLIKKRRENQKEIFLSNKRFFVLFCFINIVTILSISL